MLLQSLKILVAGVVHYSSLTTEDPIEPDSVIDLISSGWKRTRELSLFLFKFLQKLSSKKERSLVLR